MGACQAKEKSNDSSASNNYFVAQSHSTSKAKGAFTPSPGLASKIEEIISLERPIQETATIYLFGFDQHSSHRTVIQFDARDLSFKKINFPHNLSVMFYQQIVQVTENHIFVTGGINQSLNSISKSAQLWDPQSNLCFQLPDMSTIRYTHISTFYLGRLYCFGGRTFGDDNASLQRKCEYFDLQLMKWVQLPDMPRKRITGFALVYQQKIYLIGGYTDPFKRSRKIDLFNPQSNSWSVFSVKLHRGLECGLIFPYKVNEFMFVGGNMQRGPVESVNIYNFSRNTVHNRQSMKQCRVLQKGLLYQSKVYVFGGCKSAGIEVCDLQQEFAWSEPAQAQMPNYLSAEYSKHYSQSQLPCYVEQGATQKEYNETISENVYLFCTDKEPQILEFNMSNGACVSKPVPLSMRLFSYQGGVSLGQGQFLLFGGVRNFLDRVQKSAYLYNAKSESAVQKEKMKYATYAFSYSYRHPWVYVVGGRKEGEEHVAILKQCQRFNVALDSWQLIAPLNKQRVSSQLHFFYDRLFCWGGYEMNGQRPLEIEVYDEIENKWDIINYKLPFGIEAAPTYQCQPNQVMIIGGREYEGDTDKVRTLTITQLSQAKNIQACEFQGEIVEIGLLPEKKSLHHIYKPKFQDWIIIFGGSTLSPITCYDLAQNQVTKNDIVEQVICCFNEEVHKLSDSYMKQYLLLCDQDA